MNFLQVTNLSKTFIHEEEKLSILNDLSFSITQGEFASFIGPSGCGKSTLFSLLAGLETPTRGTILLNNTYNLSGKSGYMLQESLLFPWRTVLENIMLSATVKKMPSAIARNKAILLLKEFNLSKFASYYPSQLSGGMQQRIAFLRTIFFNNSFLLLDEPFGALDAITRLSSQLWLQSLLKKFNPTVLLITHDIREALLLSDTIYVLSQRPAKIVKKIHVTLPRPRKPEHLSFPHIITIEQTIRSLLLQENTV
ncbi:MAG: ABC transporter ATP-binding protein [Candidatus Levyibacteriota bacterium]